MSVLLCHIERAQNAQFYYFFVAVFLGCTSTGRVGLWFLLFYVQEPECSTGSGSGFIIRSKYTAPSVKLVKKAVLNVHKN